MPAFEYFSLREPFPNVVDTALLDIAIVGILGEYLRGKKTTSLKVE